ncbi:hypothetical protein H1R20_g12143, partial [Candolleomyces eurysporus]
MRPKHSQHSIPTFPVYSCAFLSDSTFVVGGGGGAARSGIKNKLRLYEVSQDRSIQQQDEFELEKGEDAPMSMAAHAETSTIVCGVNSPETELANGLNENCRVYNVKENKIIPLRTKGTLSSGDLEEYQKVTVLSPDGALLAVAGPHDLVVLSYPSLNPIAEPIHTEKEIYDAAFSEDSLIILTTHSLLVYSLPKDDASPPSKGKQKGKSKTKSSGEKISTAALLLLNTVNVPSDTFGEGSTFRQIKLHPVDATVAYTVINTNPPRSRQKKSVSRQGFITKWNIKSWSIEKSRKVGDKGVTCLDLSADGRYIGFGSSELSVGLLDATTLAPCATILKAHDFPPTVVKFNPSATLLVSGSPDNTLRVVTVPLTTSNSGSGTFLLILALVIIILSILLQLYLKQ